MNEFKELGINKDILKAINEQNFESPTEIQKKTIPIALKGKDIIAGSATGSGKTLAFGAGILHNCEKQGVIQSLILTPTRELAEQIRKEIKKFSKYKQLRICSVYGGVSINPQMNQLRTADIVVGTPGRILDHIGRRTIDLKNVKVLVLDEADRMLDMGFIDDVKMIIKECPKKRQTMMFSATIHGELSKIAKHYMNEPTKVSVESYVDPKKLKQVYYDVDKKIKFALLVHLLKKDKSNISMVFCNTQRNTDFVADNLVINGIDAIAIHGGLSQAKREKMLEKFHSKKANVLVCTDVAARGLDIKEVSHVYNYDIPNESKQYIHRIGRTARAGKEGMAINLVGERDHDNFSRVFRDFDIKVKKEEKPFVERVKIKRTQQRRDSRGFNRRPRKTFGRGSSQRGPPRRNRTSGRSNNRRR